MVDQYDKVKEMLKAFSQKGDSPGGISSLIQMLSQLDRKTEKHLLATLKQQDPKLAEELKKQYFCFEDLIELDDAVLKKALNEVHRTTLTLALKGTDDMVKRKILQNLSQRAARNIEEDMELMGPKPVQLVEEAQREVTKVLRRWRNVIV